MAPAVLVLGSMVVRVTSALIKKQLMKYGFKVASDYKKYSNVTNVTTKNSSRVLDNAKKLGQKLGKIKPTPTSPGGGKAVKLTDAMKKTARNAQKVSGKEFGKRKLSEFGRVGTKPKPSVAKLKSKKTGLTGVVIPLALTSSSTKDSSAPSVKNSNARVSDPPGKNPSTDPGVLNIVRIAKEALGEKKAPPAAVVKQVVKEVPKKDKYKNQTTPAEKEALRKMEAAAVKKQLSAFGKKFKSERAKGKYSFPFKGKEYTTRYKEESVAEHKKKFPKKK